MLDWTGERFLPWLEDAGIAYEHIHRYLYASQFVKDKRVLDLATGEGYGANMLASYARTVIGIDIDPAVVRHAAAKYDNPNLRFIVGSVTDIPAADRSFDVVTCFECIEHIEDQGRLLTEVKRVLDANGLFIVSTPNKSAYRPESEPNLFHVKELSAEELEAMLKTHFRNVECLGQRIHVHSGIWQSANNAKDSVHEFFIERGESEFRVAPNRKRVPIYVIALASDESFIAAEGSVLTDISNQLICQKDTLIADLIAGRTSDQRALQWLTEQVQDRQAALAGLETALKWRASQIEDLQRTIDGLHGDVDSMKHTIDDQQRTIQEYEKTLEWQASQVQQLEHDRNAVRRDLEIITSSTGWKFILQLCRIRDGLFPEGTLRRRWLKRLL